MNDQLKAEVLQLIEDCKTNNRKAQHRLFKFYFSSMFNVCMRYARDSEEAQDMLNEGFLKIFSNLDKYENSGSFEAWMKRVMINSALDYQRKYKTLVETVNYEAVPESILNVYDENNAISKISSDELMQLIQKLPPMSKNVFNLYLFENYSHAEIAKLLNIKEGTSHWHLNFAKNKLKEEIINFYKDGSF
ncbi:MAG: sigma-70 family RNA polymerase sigma factor [Bacteroidales bacterium]